MRDLSEDFAALEAHFRVLFLFEFTPVQACSSSASGIDAVDKALTQARMEGEPVWVVPQLSPPAGVPRVHDDYRLEFLEPVTQLLFGRSSPRCGWYFRLSHALTNTIFRNGLWLWPDAASMKGVTSDCLAAPCFHAQSPKGVEMFLLGSGVGVLSVSLSLEIAPERPVPIYDLKQLQYHLCQQRYRACPVLAQPHAAFVPEKLAQLGHADRQRIQPLPPLDAPLDQRLGWPGGVFTLSELTDFLLGDLRGVAEVVESHPQFALYTVIDFPHPVCLDDATTRTILAPLLSGLAQLEERDHAGSPQGEVTVPHALLNTRHWAAVSSQAAVHFLSDQYPRVDGARQKHDAQRARIVRDRYFIPWLMAALSRLQFQRAVREGARDIAELAAKGTAGAQSTRLQALQTSLLEFDALAYASEVSVRASHNRFYELCQQGLRVEELYADVTRAVHGLAFLSQQHGQQATLREHGQLLDEIRAAGRERSEYSKRLVQMTTALEKHVDNIREIQTKVEYVEIFLVSVYAVYLVHYLGEAFAFPHAFVGSMIVVGSTLAAIVAIRLLRPHDGDKAGERKLWRVLVFILGLVLVYLAAGFAANQWGKKPRASPPANQPPAQARQGEGKQ